VIEITLVDNNFRATLGYKVTNKNPQKTFKLEQKATKKAEQQTFKRELKWIKARNSWWHFCIRERK